MACIQLLCYICSAYVLELQSPVAYVLAMYDIMNLELNPSPSSTIVPPSPKRQRLEHHLSHLSQALLNTPKEHFIEAVSVDPETLRLPMATLAQQFGVTRRTIHNWLKEYPAKITPKDRFIEIVSSKPQSLQFSVATLAKQFGVTTQTTREGKG